MKILFVLAAVFIGLTGFSQKGDYLIKNNGDTIWGDITLKNKHFYIKGSVVPGYKADRRVPTVNNAIKRIASGVSFSKKGRTQNRKYSGTWYNETKMDMINVAKGRLAAKTDQWVRWQMKQQAEAEE